MFKKFKKIQNLTRFENPSCSSFEFLKFNIIFGNNGRGKSSLTSIFRSISTSNPNYLLSRQTLGQNNLPLIELLFDTPTGSIVSKFNGKSWDSSPQNILIFDSEFVDDNIFIGGKVDYVQKRGLYEVFVGKQTGTLVDQLTKEDELIRKINPQILHTRAVLEGAKKSNIDIDKYIELKKIDPSNDPIPHLEKQLETIEHKSTVLRSPKQQKIIYSPPDFSLLNSLLKMSIKMVSEKVTSTVKAHIKTLIQPDAERWIERGHELCTITNGNCPFCSQSLSTSHLTNLYVEYFNKEYKDSIRKLHQYNHQLKKELNISSLILITQIINENAKNFSYWKSLLVEKLVEPEFEIDQLQTILTQLSKSVEDLIKEKLEDPLKAIDLPKQFNDTLDQLGFIIEKLHKYNDAVIINNKIIEDFKEQLLKEDNSAEIKNKLYLALDQKKRHSKSIDDICKQYLKLKEEKSKHEKIKTALRKKLDNTSAQIIDKHQLAINDCLRNSGASFTIQRIDQDHQGGKPNSTFVLEINGEEIMADANDESAPHIKTALSAGDKTTLAFAFFVSCVEQESKLSEYLLVIDDPISSLDYERRQHTLNIIVNLFSKSEQGILLSHDGDFLHASWSRMKSNERSSFQIKRDGYKSILEAWNVEKRAESKQKERITKLQNFIDHGLGKEDKLEQIISIIRPTLEHSYKALYPKEFPSSDSLGNFIGNVKASKESYLDNIKKRIERINDINNYVTPYSSHDSGETIPEINDTELLTHVKGTLELIRS